MRLGMFMMPVHPPDRSLWSTLDEDTEKSLLADQLGFDELWMGEHFSATTEPFPSPLMFLAGLVPQTKNITFGTAVINLPNHHPAIVAAEAAQFDHMSKGRFMLGVGPAGSSPISSCSTIPTGSAQAHGGRSDRHDRAHLGAGPALRSQGRVLEHADQGRRSCPSSASASCRSPTSSRARRSHLARQPELGVGAARGAARAGASSRANIIPTYSVASHWTVYSEACGDAGHARRAATTGGVARNVVVAPSDAEARGPRVRRRRLQPLLLHLHARGAGSGRACCHPQAAARHADDEARPRRSSRNA